MRGRSSRRYSMWCFVAQKTTVMLWRLITFCEHAKHSEKKEN